MLQMLRLVYLFLKEVQKATQRYSISQVGFSHSFNLNLQTQRNLVRPAKKLWSSFCHSFEGAK